jgi:hypothetical protein
VRSGIYPGFRCQTGSRQEICERPGGPAAVRILDRQVDEVALTQIGPDREGFFRFYERELKRCVDV